LADVTSEDTHRAATGRESADPFVVGPRLIAAGAGAGPLTGRTFAVKDLFDVAGIRTGAGNPDFLAGAAPAAGHAPAVAALLAAGADLVGKTVTDEFAFSLQGTNPHYGTPRNPADPLRVPGGSSSGSAAAVGSGLVPIALGTDTGGSVRVPASYCGVLGLRTSHGRISRDGIFPMAPSLDAVGPFARTAADLRDAWYALRAGASTGAWAGPLAGLSRPGPRAGLSRPVTEFVVLAELTDLLDAGTRPGFDAAVESLAATLAVPVVMRSAPAWFGVAALRSAFRTIQLREVWSQHGDWYRAHSGSFGPGVGSRLTAAAAVTAGQAQQARNERASFAAAFGSWLGTGTYLVQPAAAGPAPLITSDEAERLRVRTLGLTAPAGLSGAPALSLPLALSAGLPLGVCVVGRPGDDDALAELAVRAMPGAS
jgi:Asp-tRNA(Asn)/Glu-tRNA(Gln) amidotransferase A subunit family amidase